MVPGREAAGLVSPGKESMNYVDLTYNQSRWTEVSKVKLESTHQA